MQLYLCTDFILWFEHVCKKTDQLIHSGFKSLGLLTCSLYILKTRERGKKRKIFIHVKQILMSILYLTYYISLDTLGWIKINLSFTFLTSSVCILYSIWWYINSATCWLNYWNDSPKSWEKNPVILTSLML